MKKLLALVLALVLCFALVACGTEQNQDENNNVTPDTNENQNVEPMGDTIKVGGVYNITGDQSTLDEPSQKGFQLAAKVINENGGINGRQIEVICYDGQTDQTVCANNTKKLINTDGVVAIGGLSDSDYAYAVGGVAQAAGVPFITSGATTPDIPAVVGDCAFMTPFGDNVCAYAAATYSFQDLGATTAYILTDNSMSYTKAIAEYFAEKFTELGGEVILQDYFSSGDYDFSAQISRYLAGGEADVMFIASGPDDASTIIQQVRSAGAVAPMISCDGWDTDLWGVAGDLANQDCYVCTHYSSADPSEIVQNFIDAYVEEYGVEPENAFAALGYDCMMVIAKAIEMCGDDVTAANVRDNLEQITDLQCVTGTITFTPENHVPDKSVVVCQAVDGALAFCKNI